jgi:hypothetical protein
MPRYAADFQRTASLTLSLGSETAPADIAMLFTVRRYTAAGTSTAVTPLALDPADPAFLGQAGENHTVDPTYTANAILLNIPLNQRATFRWVAVQGGELVYPATTANGIGIETDVISSTTPLVTAQVHVEE